MIQGYGVDCNQSSDIVLFSRQALVWHVCVLKRAVPLHSASLITNGVCMRNELIFAARSNRQQQGIRLASARRRQPIVRSVMSLPTDNAQLVKTEKSLTQEPESGRQITRQKSPLEAMKQICPAKSGQICPDPASDQPIDASTAARSERRFPSDPASRTPARRRERLTDVIQVDRMPTSGTGTIKAHSGA